MYPHDVHREGLRRHAVFVVQATVWDAGATPSRAPIRIQGDVVPPTRIKDAKPEYPAAAIADRVQGTVTIEATIGPDGKVTNARVVGSIPALDQSALDAVRQWEFTPTLLNGIAVPVIMTVTVKFSLGG